MISAPCKDCKDRHTLCWNECERYKSMKEEYAAAKAHRLDGLDAKRFLIQNMRRTKRKLHMK